MTVLLFMLVSTWVVGGIITISAEAHGCAHASCIHSVSLLQSHIVQTKLDPLEETSTSDGDEDGFHCHEALEEWRRGWSWLKMKWCCENEGIACEEMKEANSTERAPPTQGAMMNPQLELTDSIDLIVEVDTLNDHYANTTSGASVAFEIGTDWTENLELCKEASAGEKIVRMIRLPSWPNKMRVNANGEDAWGYSSIYLYFTDRRNNTAKITVLNKTDTNYTYGVGSKYWLDGEGEAPSEQIYLVPELQADVDLAMQCTTRDDPRTASMSYTTSPEGTSCVFGVEDADEGSHCIYDEGRYGSFGWCYTSKDKSSWGSCSENCPLSGQFKVLGTKVDEVLRRLQRMKDANSPLSVAPAEAQGDAIATGNRSANGSAN
jgi:hypothetical protein